MVSCASSMRQPPVPDSAAATRVSKDGWGHIIIVTAMGPNDNVPESGAAALACQLPLPRLQSSMKAAWPSATNVTVNVDGSWMPVAPLAESMLVNCHPVSVSGVVSAAAPAQVASASATAARVTSNVFTRSTVRAYLQAMATAATPRVGIIGAGMSGLCMAMKLLDDGIDSFVIYEQADDVGGTWRDNTYPGLHCDVPSPFYSYSFLPNANWTQMMPPGGEIQQYLRRVADARDIRRFIRFGTEVRSAEYRGGRWHVTTDTGVDEFDVLITATGFLRVPRYPDIVGLDTFAGLMFHSARWDHSVTLPDKRIGLIGTGSTGVQIAAELGGKVKQLNVFQRTAQWVSPFPNMHYRARRAMVGRFPALARPGYAFWSWFVMSVFGNAPLHPGLARRYFSLMCVWNLRLSVRDRALNKKLTPTYQPMCKRQVFSSGYYRAVQKPGVEVITDRIDHVEPRGVVTADGKLHEIDVLVLATGFDARAYVRPIRIIGADGRSLDDVWGDGPYAYRSVAVPGFPNLLMLMGPHSPIANQSMVPVAEDQADYALWWIKQMRDGRVNSFAPSEVATKLYNEEIESALPQTIWASGCDSWYLGKNGLPEVFPWNPARHRELLRSPVVADFEVRNS